MPALVLADATLTVSAPGGSVPAFSGQTVTVPSHLSVTAPGCIGGGCGTIDRTAPLVVTWSGGATGTVSVSVSAFDAPATSGVTCKAPASAGTLTVPAALLANLYAGKSGSFSVATTSEVKFNAGAWPITVTVRDNAVTGTITTSP